MTVNIDNPHTLTAVLQQHDWNTKDRDINEALFLSLSRSLKSQSKVLDTHPLNLYTT